MCITYIMYIDYSWQVSNGYDDVVVICQDYRYRKTKENHYLLVLFMKEELRQDCLLNEHACLLGLFQEYI